MIKFFCIHCGTKIAAEDEWEGQESVCPTCQQSILVPGIAEGCSPILNAATSEAVTARACPNHSADDHAFRCSGCKLTIYAATDQIGSLVDCPHCAATVMVAPSVNESMEPVIVPKRSKRRPGPTNRVRHGGIIITGVVAACALMMLCLLGIIELPSFGSNTAQQVSDSSSSQTVDRETAIEQALVRELEREVGSQVRQRLNSRMPCDGCDGTGQRASTSTDAAIIANAPDRLGLRLSNPELFCRSCSGAGTIRTPSGYVGLCGKCGGTGANPSKTCGKCGGSGYREER